MMKNQPKFNISVVATIYNFEQGVEELCELIDQNLSSLNVSWEAILIDDGSRDNSYLKIRECSRKHPNIKGVSMLRNFGQHAALAAGIQIADGEYVVIMDGDLQDSPTLIPTLYHHIKKEEADVIYVRRKERSDSVFKKMSSRAYYTVLSKLSGVKFDHEIGTFRIMNRLAVDSFNQLPETQKFIGGLFHWLGFKGSYLDAEQLPRKYGKSGYSLKRLFALAEKGIIGNSFKPLNFSIYLGIFSAIVSFIIGGYYILMKILNNIPVPGYTSIIVTIFFVGGIILFVLGIFGKYIAQILIQVRRRPEFIFRNFTENWDERIGN